MKVEKIYLSASQQPNNEYADKAFTEEEAMHIYVRDFLAPEVIALGYQVKVSDPKNDMNINIEEGNAFLGSLGLYISHHTNASGTGKNDGTLVLAFPSPRSQILANELYKAISPITPATDEGIRLDPGLAELRRTHSTACLIEIFYHDNLADMKWGITHFAQIAKAEAQAIDKAAKILSA